MSDKLAVTTHETGLYRVFSINLPPIEVENFTTATKDSYPLQDALGLRALNPDHVQIVDLKEMQSLGLETYLSEGLGIAPADYADALPLLDAAEGHLAVIASAAFTKPDIIVPKPPLALLAVLAEHKPHKPLMDLQSDSAAGTLGTPDSATLPSTPMPLWAKIAITVVTCALLYLLYALFIAGDPS